jgi:hypothetical protein
MNNALALQVTPVWTRRTSNEAAGFSSSIIYCGDKGDHLGSWRTNPASREAADISRYQPRQLTDVHANKLSKFIRVDSDTEWPPGCSTVRGQFRFLDIFWSPNGPLGGVVSSLVRGRWGLSSPVQLALCWGEVPSMRSPSPLANYRNHGYSNLLPQFVHTRVRAEPPLCCILRMPS